MNQMMDLMKMMKKRKIFKQNNKNKKTMRREKKNIKMKNKTRLGLMNNTIVEMMMKKMKR